MKNFGALVIGVVLLMICGCTQEIDIEKEKAQVNTVLDQLIQSTETKDMELTSKIYAHDSDMVTFGTDSAERIVGWESLKEVMQEQFSATGDSEFTVKDQVVKVNHSGNAAWFSEVIDWTLDFEDQTMKMEGLRVTGVLEKRNENWVIVQLHYSMPAVKQEVQD